MLRKPRDVPTSRGGREGEESAKTGRGGDSQGVSLLQEKRIFQKEGMADLAIAVWRSGKRIR